MAPVLILISRLILGLSAGVEVGGVSVYLSEIATPGNKGFYVAWLVGDPSFERLVTVQLYFAVVYSTYNGRNDRVPDRDHADACESLWFRAGV